MTGYIARRVVSSLVMVVLVSIVIFVVLRLLPGDPSTTRLGQADGLDPQAIEKMRASLGLDRPVLVQYWSWVSGLVVGDLGFSYFSGYPVSRLLAQRLPATLELAGAGLLVGMLMALVAAILPARTRSRTLRRLVDAGTVFGLSAPPFVIGILAILLFSTVLGVAPSSGYVAFSDDPAANLQYLALPALTLGIVVAAPLVRYLQSSIAEVEWSTFVRTARGKGIGWVRTLDRHILPNALLPALTSLGITVGTLLGGSVVVESVFAWPGVGQQVVDAVLKRDYAVIQSIVLLTALAFVVTTLLVDVLYGVLDPRLRVSRGRSRRASGPRTSATGPTPEAVSA